MTTAHVKKLWNKKKIEYMREALLHKCIIIFFIVPVLFELSVIYRFLN